MTSPRSSAIGLYLRFLVLAVGVSVGMVLLGYWPTARLGGSGAVPAMFVGCGLSLIASLVGAIPVVLAARGPAAKVPQATLTSMVVRFLVVLVLALSAVLSGWFERSSLLMWVAVSYLLLLVVDTLFAVRLGGSADTSEK